MPVKALVEIADWLLDLATTSAHEDHDDLAAVESVRGYLHDLAARKAAEVPSEEELLSVIAMVVVALEQKHGLRGLGDGVAVGLRPGDARAGAARAAPRTPRDLQPLTNQRRTR